jgi:hypothetical protein
MNRLTKNAVLAGCLVGAIVVAIFAGRAIFERGGLNAWDRMSSLGKQTMASEGFTVEASSFNLRGYAFTSPDGQRCIFVAGTEKGGLSCEWTAVVVTPEGKE